MNPNNSPSRLHTLDFKSSQGTLGNRWTLLEVLDHELASRSPHLLDFVGLGVVGQPTSIGDSLHHLFF